MKWTIAGAGVLLSVAGAYAVITGSSIIQVERGWATFIAGAVLLSGGIITLGIAALMGRIDNLTEVYIASIESLDAHEERPQVSAPPEDSTPPATIQRAEPQPSNENAAPAPTHREARAYQPAFTPPPPPPEPVPEPVAAPAPVEAAPAPAPALRDFKFVFPPAEAAPEPAPAPIPMTRPAPLDIKTPAVAAASSLTWLRRNKQRAEEAAAAPTPEPEPIIEPAPQPVQEAAAQDEPAEEPAFATLASAYDEDQRVAPEPDAVPAPEPVADTNETAETKSEPEGAAGPDPFSNDWLERALSGSDEPRLAPSSPRREPAVETLIEAPAPNVHEEHTPQLAVIESEPAEPVPAPEREPEPAAVDASDAPAPVEIGRYRANDVAYVMFSDGSITAETPAGASYRFNSLVELRAFIERGGA